MTLKGQTRDPNILKSTISRKLHEIETSNLVCSFVSGMPSGCTKHFPESWRGLGHVTPTIFGSTVGYPSDSLASCLILLQPAGDCTNEIKRRIVLARQKAVELTAIWKDKNVTSALKIRVMKSMVWAVFQYGVEGWTLNISDRNRIESFEMW